MKTIFPSVASAKLNKFKRIVLLALGALISFSLAYELGFTNTYWASIPIWVIASDSTEELLLKGLYRTTGTILGSVLAVAIVATVPWTFLKVVFLAFFMTFFTTLAKTQKALYGYSNFLTAITMAIVSLPAIYENNSWEIMSSRISCTMIGVIVSIFILYLSSKRTYVHKNNSPILPSKNTLQKIINKKFIKAFATIFVIIFLAYLVIIYGNNHGLKTDSELAAFGLIVFAIVLGVNDNPNKQSFFVLRGALSGALAALFYRYYIHPIINDQILLYLSLIPFFTIGAILKLSSFESKGAIDANLCFLLIAKPGDYSIEFFSYIGHLKFLLIGALAIMAIYQLPFVLSNLKIEYDR